VLYQSQKYFVNIILGFDGGIFTFTLPKQAVISSFIRDVGVMGTQFDPMPHSFCLLYTKAAGR
jgi:hypothetical protein